MLMQAWQFFQFDFGSADLRRVNFGKSQPLRAGKAAECRCSTRERVGFEAEVLEVGDEEVGQRRGLFPVLGEG